MVLAFAVPVRRKKQPPKPKAPMTDTALISDDQIRELLKGKGLSDDIVAQLRTTLSLFGLDIQKTILDPQGQAVGVVGKKGIIEHFKVTPWIERQNRVATFSSP